MPVKFSTALRTSRVTQILNALDAGTGAGTIRIYTGTQPATAADPLSGNTLLGTLTLSDPAGTISGGVLTLSTIAQDTSADATGVATWARVVDSDSNTVMDLPVGAIGSGSAIEISSTSIVAGGPISITSGAITEGNA